MTINPLGVTCAPPWFRVFRLHWTGPSVPRPPSSASPVYLFRPPSPNPEGIPTPTPGRGGVVTSDTTVSPASSLRLGLSTLKRPLPPRAPTPKPETGVSYVWRGFSFAGTGAPVTGRGLPSRSGLPATSVPFRLGEDLSFQYRTLSQKHP